MAYDKSVSYFKEGKFDLALEQINLCLKETQGDFKFIEFRARIYTRMNSYQLAKEDFDKLLEADPYNPSYINDRAVVLHLMKDNKEALAEFDRAANLDPKNPYRYASRAFFKDRIGDLHGAIEDYDKAIALDPEDAVSLNNKGMVEEKLGYAEQSKKTFKRADELVGYKPKGTSDLPPIGDKKENSTPENIQIEENEKPPKLTFSGFVNVVKDLMTNSNSRKEFVEFLKRGLK